MRNLCFVLACIAARHPLSSIITLIIGPILTEGLSAGARVKSAAVDYTNTKPSVN